MELRKIRGILRKFTLTVVKLELPKITKFLDNFR